MNSRTASSTCQPQIFSPDWKAALTVSIPTFRASRTVSKTSRCLSLGELPMNPVQVMS